MDTIKKAIILGAAAIIQGAAMATFLFPYYIPSGGAASVGVLLKYLCNVPYAISLLVLNASLLLVAAKWLGRSNALWTMYCVTVTSAMIDFVSSYMREPLTNIYIDLVFGAVLFGVGLGILFRMGASSGGMDILALIVAKVMRRTPGRILFWINSSLLLLTGIVVDWMIIVYALICQYIGTRIIDVIYQLPIKQLKGQNI
ncbi:YitT family protein [Salirhabdus salicampi]|uniref:YitT family protein n=1 Tax=Salirhabdus salicampi TaxID=476102 RepID=UPI0020C249E7|nr:YitT family protein [Salirhabdus salicampi]MCP8615856.1 YitT family protein [Salirhabdus salicampi]